MEHEQDQPEEIDIDELIFSKSIIPGIVALRNRRGCSLHEALSAFEQRYKVLRAEQPERFVCDETEYWKNFYS